MFATGRGHIVLADSKGNVYIVDRSFKTQMFIAYDGGRVTHLKQLKQKNILVTVGVRIKCITLKNEKKKKKS